MYLKNLFFASDKALKVPIEEKDYTECEAAGWQQMAWNPLRKTVGAKAETILCEYYQQKEEALPLVESFDDICFFSKRGMEPGAYVVYVKYRMKMKDIYTKVPGLGTFYMKWNGSDGTYDLFTGSELEEARGEIPMLNGHEDVQMLLRETRKEYTEAVESDALLREFVSDIADEGNTTGTIR